SNEISIRIRNDDRRFDVDNDQSPLFRLLKPNRRIRAWLGAVAENQATENPPTFARNSVAYLSDGTQVAAGVPRFEQAVFGQGLRVEEGTANLWSGTSNKTGTWRRNGGSWITFVSDNEILVDFTVEGSADYLLYYPSLNGVSERPYTFSVEYEV